MWNSISSGLSSYTLSSARNKSTEKLSNSSTDEEIQKNYKEILINFQVEQLKIWKAHQAIFEEKENEIIGLKGQIQELRKLASDAGVSIPDEVPSFIKTSVQASESSLQEPVVSNSEEQEKTAAVHEREKAVLELSSDWEARLREALAEKYGALAEAQNLLSILNDKNNLIKSLQDKIAAQEEMMTSITKNTQKVAESRSSDAETIDGLVEEYTRLSAESSAQHEQDQKRIKSLQNQCAELSTKLRAYEQNLLHLMEKSEMGSTVSNTGAFFKLSKKCDDLEVELSAKDDQIVRLLSSISGMGEGGKPASDILISMQKQLQEAEKGVRTMTKLLRESETKRQFLEKQVGAFQGRDLKGTELDEQGNIRSLQVEMSQLKAEKETLERQLKRQKQIDENPAAAPTILAEILQATEAELARSKSEVDNLMRSYCEQSLFQARVEALRAELQAKEKELAALKVSGAVSGLPPADDTKVKELQEQLDSTRKEMEEMKQTQTSLISRLESVTKIAQDCKEKEKQLAVKHKLLQTERDVAVESLRKKDEALREKDKGFAEAVGKLCVQQQEYESRLAAAMTRAEHEKEKAVAKARAEAAAAKIDNSNASEQNARMSFNEDPEHPVKTGESEAECALLKAALTEKERALEALRAETTAALEKMNEDRLLAYKTVETLESLRVEMENGMHDELSQLKEKHQKTLSETQLCADRNLKQQLEQLKASLSQEHAQALAEMAQKSEMEKCSALETLRLEKDAQMASALEGMKADFMSLFAETIAENEQKAEREKALALESLKIELEQEKMLALASFKNESQNEQKPAPPTQILDEQTEGSHMIEEECQRNVQEQVNVENSASQQEIFQKNVQLAMERDMYKNLYVAEFRKRKHVKNDCFASHGGIRVFCRVRPILEDEKRAGQTMHVTETPGFDQLVLHRKNREAKKFEFSEVFGAEMTQEQVFEAVKPLSTSLLHGSNACIFAFGQTGAGKSYTLQGTLENPGVGIRLFQQILAGQENKNRVRFSNKMSVFEVYNDEIIDLLDCVPSKPESAVLDSLALLEDLLSDVKSDAQKQESAKHPSTEVPQEQEVASMQQILELMSKAASKRAVGHNPARSNFVITMHIEGQDAAAGTHFSSYLHIVDLAGSNHLSKSEATATALKEIRHVGKTLSCLGDVLSAVNARVRHVPYRNSKLTYLLRDSLKHDSKVIMFANISPAECNQEETLCSLNFVARCQSFDGDCENQVLMAKAKKTQSCILSVEEEPQKEEEKVGKETSKTESL